MLFVHSSIVLVDKTKHRVNVKFLIWRNALEAKCFPLSRTKTKYIECKINKCINNDEGVVRLYDQEMPKEELSISWINNL